MGKRIKWSTDFKRYPERRCSYKGLKGIGKAIVQVLLVLCALYAMYAFFDKTELNSGVIELTEAVETKPAAAGILDSWGGASAEEGSQQDEDRG